MLFKPSLLVVGGKVVGAEDDICSRDQIEEEDEKSRAALHQLKLEMRNVVCGFQVACDVGYVERAAVRLLQVQPTCYHEINLKFQQRWNTNLKKKKTNLNIF